MKPRSNFILAVAVSVVLGGSALAAAAESPPGTAATPQPSDESRGDRDRAQPPASETGPASGSTGMASGKAPPPDDFARMDTDNDGRISAEEYSSSYREAVARVAAGKRRGTEAPNGGFELYANEGQPQQSEIFQRWDADGDGYLSRAELRAVTASSEERDKGAIRRGK